MRSKEASRRRLLVGAVVVVGVIGQILMIIYFHVWQDEVRDLNGVPRMTFWDHPLTAVLVDRRAVHLRGDRPAHRQAGAASWSGS